MTSGVRPIRIAVQVQPQHTPYAQLRDAVRASRSGADLFDTELIIRAEHSGLVTAEVPVTVTELRPARTSIARRVPRTLVGLAVLRVRLGGMPRG